MADEQRLVGYREKCCATFVQFTALFKRKMSHIEGSYSFESIVHGVFAIFIIKSHRSRRSMALREVGPIGGFQKNWVFFHEGRRKHLSGWHGNLYASCT